MSRYFVVNGYQSDYDFYIPEEDFKALYELLGDLYDEATESPGSHRMMIVDLSHMALTNMVKKIVVEAAQTPLTDNKKR